MGANALRRRRIATSPVIAGLAAMALLIATPGVAWAVEPATPMGFGTTSSIVVGVNAPDNEVWWGTQDPNSPAKVFFSFNTTPALGIPTPALIALGRTPGAQWYGGAATAAFTTSDNPPSINSAFGSVSWVPSAQAFHLVVTEQTQLGVVGNLSADLWFAGPAGGAGLPSIWDGQTSYWTQAVGTGHVNGTVTFPGSTVATTVTNWTAEQETEYGTYQLGPGPQPAPAIHIGYDYATSYNPDGSTDTMDVFPEFDGVWRGILTHTSAAGVTTECADPKGRLSNWYADPGGFSYPLSVELTCGTTTITWTTTPAGSQVLYNVNQTDGFALTNSAGVSSVPGSVAYMQHIRDTGYWGQTPAWG